MMDPALLARRAEVKVFFDGVDISLDMRRYLLSLSYTDVASGEADDLNMEIDDRERAWTNSWLGKLGNDIKGLSVSAAIIQKNWLGDGKDRLLDCGVFELDHIGFSGPPRKVTISATAMPYSSEIRQHQKTRAWESIKLSVVAAEIAGSSGLKLIFESAYDHRYARCEQVDESDIAFLDRLCTTQGLCLKVGMGKLIIFNEAEYEKLPPVLVFTEGGPGIITYNFSTGLSEVYDSCRVAYQDPVSGKLIEGTFNLPGKKKDSSVLEIKEKVLSSDEARQVAEKRLREHNKGEYRCSMRLSGNTGIAAGLTAGVEGFGLFDGTHFIERAVHTVSSGGYFVNVEMRRTLEF